MPAAVMTVESLSPSPPASTDAIDPRPVDVSDAADAGAWDRYVQAHPDGTADHLWGWRSVFEGVLGHRTLYLTAQRGGQTVGVLPLVLFRSRLFGRSAISLPFLNDGGLLADDEAVRAALIDAATARGRAFGATHLELRHRARQMPSLPYRQHKLGLTLALPGTSEDLWKGIDRKIRNQVRKAQKEGLEAVTGGLEHVEDFYRVFAENMRDLGTPVYPRRLFEETLRQFPDHARLTIVKYKGQPVASGFVIAWRGTVVNPWASSLRAFRHLCPNMLLYWSMLERAVQDGERVFDFGRSSPGGGTHQFKLQWGAVETPLHWEYVLLSRADVPNQGPTNPKFERAIQIWQRLPLALANAIGPYIARQLP
jgi:FemAB-related protein (PEP-CTERM system-associated)